ncbi:MAG: WecB/TagA/CpsF family glycosyltransferase [Candidatus Saganbacteria bacterium]|nr:WecB/TagA/CpsF family glycosyltransferase [Candidatus Saganbacteria bacterium]
MNIINFAGIKVDNVTLAEASARVFALLSSTKPQLIVTPNPEMIVTSQSDKELKEIINSAALRVPDGISMVVVSKILGKPLKERVSGIDLMLSIIKSPLKKGLKIFLLGGKPGVAEKAAVNLARKYPAINIVGTQDGYFKDDAKIIEEIKKAQPDILFAGLGAGRQEKWLNRHLKELGVPVSMTIGGTLDVISGQKKRAPKWIQALYIEWLYRLITEPNRWKRQLALPQFLWLMFFPKKSRGSD